MPDIVLSTRDSAIHKTNGLYPWLVGRLAGKTNVPTDYGKVYLKIVKKKRD